jgi:hypothetical protein
MFTWIKKFFTKKSIPKPQTIEERAVEISKGIMAGTIRTIPYFTDSVDPGLYTRYSNKNNNMREEIK